MEIRSLLSLVIPLLFFTNSAQAEEEMSLEQFLSVARTHNLPLQAEAAEAQVARNASSGLAIPPPMVALTQMKDDSGRATNFEISQTIPFPTQLASDRSARRFEADAKDAFLLARRQELLAEGKFLYFKLWKSQGKIQLLQEKKLSLEQHLKLATATTRSDSFLKIHVIKVESDLDLLLNEVLQAEEERRELQIAAAEFLDKDPQIFKLLAQDFTPSTIPNEEDLRRPQQIESKRLDLEMLGSRETEAKSKWLPEFTLRYREMGGTPMTPSSNEVMLGATLPFIFYWEPSSASEKASTERLRGEISLAQEKRRIESRKFTLLTRAESLSKQLDQFNKKLLPRAEKRKQIVLNIAPRDAETLQDHRETMEAVPELKLKALEVREKYEEAVTELEKYISGGKK